MPKEVKCKFCNATLYGIDIQKSWNMTGNIGGKDYTTTVLLYKCPDCGKHTRIGKPEGLT